LTRYSGRCNDTVSISTVCYTVLFVNVMGGFLNLYFAIFLNFSLRLFQIQKNFDGKLRFLNDVMSLMKSFKLNYLTYSFLSANFTVNSQILLFQASGKHFSAWAIFYRSFIILFEFRVITKSNNRGPCAVWRPNETMAHNR